MGRRLVVIDTAVPRDVDPSARDLPGVELYDLDDIQREVAQNLSAREAEARARRADRGEQELASFERWIASLEVVPTISALRERGRAAVERALRENERRWQALTDDDRERVALVAQAWSATSCTNPRSASRRAGELGSSSFYVETVRELLALAACPERTRCPGTLSRFPRASYGTLTQRCFRVVHGAIDAPKTSRGAAMSQYATAQIETTPQQEKTAHRRGPASASSSTQRRRPWPRRTEPTFVRRSGASAGSGAGRYAASCAGRFRRDRTVAARLGPLG